MSVGGAAHIAQEGGVVDGRLLGGASPEALAQPGREQTGAHRIVGRLAVAQIGRHGEGGQQVREAQGRGRVLHVETLILSRPGEPAAMQVQTAALRLTPWLLCSPILAPRDTKG